MRILFLITIITFSQQIYSQEANISIDLGIKKYIGKISELNRERYFGIQSSYMSENLSNEAPYLIKELNTHFAKDINGPQPSGELKGLSAASISEITAKKKSQNYSNSTYRNKNYLLTQKDASKVFTLDTDIDKASSKIIKYIEEAYVSPPRYYDLMENPFDENNFDTKNPKLLKQNISSYYRDVSEKIKKKFPEMLIGGFSSSRPSFEKNNFENWTNTHQLFYDIAGDKMDFFSLGLYDEVNLNSDTINYCSGSNLEATLDLIETYSFNKWNKITPFLISDYGLKVPSWIGKEYNEQRDTFIIESLNKILMSLLDKPDRIEKAIPHILGSPTDEKNPFSILKKSSNGNTSYSHLVKFYEFWKDVEGDRTYISSDNPDIQANAFVKNGKWYLIFNNLSNKNQTLNFNFSPIDIDVISKYTLRRLFMNEKGAPELTEAFTDLHIDQWDIEPNETLMLICDVPKDIEYATSIVEYNNYSREYLKDIQSGVPLNFSVNNVKTGIGKAFIRLSFGRKINLSLKPIIKINGNVVLTPKNWAGDFQKSREDFFGTFNIPVPMSYIKESNDIELKFANTGGKVSSVILNTEIFSDDVNNKNFKETTSLVYASHGGNLLNVSEKIECKSPKITDVEGHVIKRLRSYNNGDTIDISTLKNGQYFLETSAGVKHKFKK